MKFLKSVNQDKKEEIKHPKRNILLFVALLVIGITAYYAGIAINGLLGFLIIILGNAFIIAGFMQIIGTSECICPDCKTNGFIFKYSKSYKCKNCGTTSVVVTEDK